MSSDTCPEGGSFAFNHMACWVLACCARLPPSASGRGPETRMRLMLTVQTAWSPGNNTECDHHALAGSVGWIKKRTRQDVCKRRQYEP